MKCAGSNIPLFFYLQKQLVLIFFLFSLVGGLGFLFNLVGSGLSDDNTSIAFAQYMSIHGFVDSVPLVGIYITLHVILLYFIFIHSKVWITR